MGLYVDKLMGLLVDGLMGGLISLWLISLWR